MLLTVSVDPVELSTEELQQLVAAGNDELRRRHELGDGCFQPRHWRLLLDRLGQTPQTQVLREAARAEDGYVSRDRVMQLLNRDPHKRLNGFRKPIERALAHLASTEPDFPSGPGVKPLHVDYAGGVTAHGFYVLQADRKSLRHALQLDRDR